MIMNYGQNQYSRTKDVNTKDFSHCMPLRNETGTSSEAFTFEVWWNDFRLPTHVLCIQVLLKIFTKTNTAATLQSEY